MRDARAARDCRSPRAGAVLEAFTDHFGTVRRSPPESVRLLRAAITAEAPGPAVRVIDAGATRLPDDPRRIRARAGSPALELEDGGEFPLVPDRAGPRATLRAPAAIPPGVHRVRGAGRDMFVLARPRSLARAVSASGRRTAVFLPLYSASPGGPFGIGTYTDLRDLCARAGEFGGALVGTLPLFPAFLHKPFDPSPYAPVTRLMWSELFIDPAIAPEWPLLTRRVRAARPDVSEYVDYRRSWRAARRALSAMAGAARRSPRRWAEVLSTCSAETVRYARFRAVVDDSGRTWDRWPASWMTLERAPQRQTDIDMYLYAQSLAGAQMHALGRSRAGASPLYLDLPVGVHGGGFDTFCRPDLFLRGFSAGAPPDDLNAHGQVWGFPPLHPFAGRADGYRYLRRVLRGMLGVAGALRIDHVMGLYRMYCVPAGAQGAAGAYVRYPEDELFAVVMIEAARAGAVVVGEDLGTVPPPVRAIMRRRGILGMHVQQFAFGAGDRPVRLPAARAMACLNTHDTPTFAGFWRADDVALRRALGHTDGAPAAEERRGRAKLRRAIASDLRRRGLPAGSAPAAAMSLMRLHARSPSPLVAVNLEDLWGERRPQNVPGTSTEHPNWRRRSALPLQAIIRSRKVAAALKVIARERRRTP